MVFKCIKRKLSKEVVLRQRVGIRS